MRLVCIVGRPLCMELEEPSYISFIGTATVNEKIPSLQSLTPCLQNGLTSLM